MGLISILGKAFTGVSKFLGLGTTAAATAQGAGGLARFGAAAGRGFRTVARSPIAQGFAGAGAFELGARAFGGAPVGQQGFVGEIVTPLVGGRAMLATNDGSMVVVDSRGQPVRPKFIIPSTARLPAGAMIVFISADRTQIGVTIKRRRRQFGAEIRRVRRTIKAAEAVVKACKPRRRSS